MNLPPPPPMDFLLPHSGYSFSSAAWPSSHSSSALLSGSAYRSHGSHCSCCPPQSPHKHSGGLPSLSQYHASWGFFNGQGLQGNSNGSSSSRSIAAMTYLAPDGHPSVPTLVPELGFSPTPSDGYSSDVPPSPTSSLESQLNALGYESSPRTNGNGMHSLGAFSTFLGMGMSMGSMGHPTDSDSDVHVICNAPLVAPVPLPRHLPTLFSCELPDIDEDLSHPPYMRPFKRKRASSVVRVADDDVDADTSGSATEEDDSEPHNRRHPQHHHHLLHHQHRSGNHATTTYHSQAGSDTRLGKRKAADLDMGELLDVTAQQQPVSKKRRGAESESSPRNSKSPTTGQRIFNRNLNGAGASAEPRLSQPQRSCSLTNRQMHLNQPRRRLGGSS